MQFQIPNVSDEDYVSSNRIVSYNTLNQIIFLKLPSDGFLSWDENVTIMIDSSHPQANAPW